MRACTMVEDLSIEHLVLKLCELKTVRLKHGSFRPHRPRA